MVGMLVCCWYVPTSKQCLFCLHNNDIKRPLLPFMTYKFPRHFASLSGHWKDWQTTGHSMRCVKVSLQCWVCYDIFCKDFVIVSSMYNYGAASPTWILALAKLTRKGVFESYQLMQTSSATTSTMKWCQSVRLLHSKCTSVSRAMHQYEHGFLVVCTVCVYVKNKIKIFYYLRLVFEFRKKNLVQKSMEILVLKWNATTFGLPLLSLCCYLE